MSVLTCKTLPIMPVSVYARVCSFVYLYLPVCQYPGRLQTVPAHCRVSQAAADCTAVVAPA